MRDPKSALGYPRKSYGVLLKNAIVPPEFPEKRLTLACVPVSGANGTASVMNWERKMKSW
jgi:hypothetical protein